MTMRPALFRKPFFLIGVILGLLWIMLACGLPTFVQTRPAPAPSLTNAKTNANAVLPEPAAGLAGLQSYQVVFSQSVKGSLDGNPYERDTDVEYSRAASKDEELVRDINSTGDPESYLHSARIGGAFYSQQAKDAPCQGGLLDPQQAPIPVPASNLLPVISGDRVGEETVNGIPAIHYRFTQAGLPVIQKDTQVSGEMWIASPGGFVVKYLLTSPVPAHPSGKGLEAGQTWDYELSQANAIDQIPIPPGCEPVPVDIPAMADAQAVEFSAGQLTYTTPSNVAQVIDFYNQKLPALGWKNTGTTKPKDSSNSTLLYYQQGSQDLTIFMDSTSGALQITVVLSNQTASNAASPTATPAPGMTAQPAATPQPAATADFSKSGLPSDVPLYPGATNLVSLAGMGMQFSTSDTSEAVTSFYKTHLTASGWSLLSEATSGDHTAQIWQKNGKTLNVVVTAQKGATSIILALTP